MQGWRAAARGLFANFLWDPKSAVTLPVALSEWAALRPYDVALECSGEQWTVTRLDQAVKSRASDWEAAGIGAGDVVAVELPNSAEYIIELLALMSRGIVAALLPTHLAEQSRGRMMRAVRARAVVSLEGVRHLEFALQPSRGAHAEVPKPDDSRAVTQEPASPVLSDVAAYIFTSGTTGLPKAALVKHHRFYRAGMMMGGALGICAKDRLYCCLPLYHGNAAVIALSCCLYARARLILAKSFSASRVLDECRESGATLLIYIGELCRFLAAVPQSPLDRQHQLRAILGNGLRADLWPVMRDRFGIEQIREYYAATEGNAETLNFLGFAGSVGPLIPWQMAVVAADRDTGALVRDARGRCRRVWPGEPGMLLGKITARNEFAGYRDPTSTSDKIAREVFRARDAWFVSGDLVRMDYRLHLYFVDRVGDTFRWNGENVSTQEVADVLRSIDGVLDATVFGVQVPGHEGRVGMAAVVLDPALGVDVASMLGQLRALLPPYAVPRFLRIVAQIETTQTLKHRKLGLISEGYQQEIADPIWIGPRAARHYEPLTTAHREQLIAQTLRL